MKVFILSIIALCILGAALAIPFSAAISANYSHFDTCATSLTSNLLCHSDKTGLFSFLLLLSMMLYFVISYLLDTENKVIFSRIEYKENSQNFSIYMSKRKLKRWISQKENSPSS